MEIKYYPDSHYEKMRFAVFVFAVFVLIFHFYSNTLLHQLCSPVFVFPEADNTYWLFHLLNIPKFLVSNYWIALSFDSLFFLFAILSLIYRNNRVFPILFWIFLITYFIFLNTFLCHHVHMLVGLIFIIIPFVADKKHFAFLWDGVRYYALFIYVSSALWKICRGNLFDEEHFSAILHEQSINLLSVSPSDFRTGLIQYLLQHQTSSYIADLLGIIFQLSFGIGFFTKRFDRILIIIGIAFHLFIYLLMDILYIELFVLYLTMIPIKEKSNSKRAIFNYFWS